MSSILASLTRTPEQLATDRTNRLASITKWNTLRDNFKSDYYKDKRHILPDDLDEIKEFLRKRVTELRKNTTMTTEALDLLNNNIDTQHYDALVENYKARVKFATFWEDIAKVLATAESAASQPMKTFVAGAIAWMKTPSNKYLSPDDYDVKMDDLLETGSHLIDNRSVSVTGIKEWLASIASNEDAKQDIFSVTDMIVKMLGITGIIVAAFLAVVLGLMGASLASNMNAYRGIGFRILYMLYGFIFFPIVIMWALWRWIGVGKKPEFFAFLPVYEGRIEARLPAYLFSWAAFDSLSEAKKTELLT